MSCHIHSFQVNYFSLNSLPLAFNSTNLMISWFSLVARFAALIFTFFRMSIKTWLVCLTNPIAKKNDPIPSEIIFEVKKKLQIVVRYSEEMAIKYPNGFFQSNGILKLTKKYHQISTWYSNKLITSTMLEKVVRMHLFPNQWCNNWRS